ncbi:MAG: serine hydrolase [Ignavibacteria bacterium]|nr:serine hydrolase [Ignavibacteria bacterium]MDP3830054.1 serine hydrolase [Ignavibacteriaceae bacterium]
MKKQIFIVFILFANLLFAQNGNDKYTKLLKDWVNYYDVPSLSAGVASNGKIVWTGSYGFADLEFFVPASPQTSYRVASISKSFTAVAIMQLVEKGKLKLDDDIRKYLPQFPKKNWVFTIRQVLNHTSGIRSYKNQAEFDSKVNYETTSDIIKYLASDTLEYEPGTKYLYSTLSYNILAAIIENVTGLYFDEYLKRNIFEPAGMKNSYLDYYNQIIPMRASMYTRNKKRVIENAPLVDHTFKFPGGGIISSIEDLLKFGSSLLNNTLLKQATIDSMLKPTILPSGEKRNYGLGFSFSSEESKRYYFGHTGSWHSSDLQIYPKEKVVVVHLMNFRDRNPDNPSIALAHLNFKDSVEYIKKPVSDMFFNVTTKFGIDSVLKLYEVIQQDSNYNFSKREWMYLANDLLVNNFNQDAIITYTKILEEFPESADVYLGLANAYLKDKNEGLALKNFRKVLLLDPKNLQANNQVKKLTGGQVN